MTHTASKPAEELAFWHAMQRRLQALAVEPPLSPEEAEAVLAQLPPARHLRESVGDRIRRADSVRFTPLITIVRLAADSDDTLPLPDPERPFLESDDGRFRLGVRAQDTRVEITLEALGFAADEFAHCRLGLAPTGAWYVPEQTDAVTLPRTEVVAVIDLNEDGDGQCLLEDSVSLRRALLGPVIGLIEEA